MVIEACRAVLTERCRLMCKQRGRQHLAANLSGPATSVKNEIWQVSVDPG
jgi:hypothetical protein